jgi:hypothetical protein
VVAVSLAGVENASGVAAQGIVDARDRLEMRRIAAAPVRAGGAACALLGLVAHVINGQPVRDRPIRELIGQPMNAGMEPQDT